MQMLLDFTRRLHHELTLMQKEESYRPNLMKKLSADFISWEVTSENYIPQLIRILWATYPGIHFNYLLNLCDTAIYKHAVPKENIWEIWEDFFISYFSKSDGKKSISPLAQPAQYILEGIIKSMLTPESALPYELRRMAHSGTIHGDQA